MQFKHPEILYALLLLIIPILVHLFQLQRFIKVPFTNVKILKTIEKQTRKSARLKKWLVLITRLLIFTCLIIAFSQPYFSKNSIHQNFNTTVYLDNSFSMQAKGKSGELLKSAAQELIENYTNSNHSISLLTNNQSFKNLTPEAFKNELIKVKYHPNKLDLNSILLKAQSLESTKENTLNNLIVISDFQDFTNNTIVNFETSKAIINLVKVTANNTLNSFIDSVFIEDNSSTEITIHAIIKTAKNTTSTIPISLFNNEILIGKTTSKFKDSKIHTVQFTIPKSTNFNGKILLIDDSLEFDNTFYFSISKPEKINVLSIGSTAKFLNKIYTKTEFNYTTTLLQNLNYNNLQNQHLIVLNELKKIPTELINSLQDFTKKGGNLVIIPSVNTHLDSYNLLFRTLNLEKIINKIESEHKIMTINYEHPLLNDVFEKRVHNFQYPKTTTYFQTKNSANTSIIKLDNNQPFISSKETRNGTIYFISSPLNQKISDFTQSPLVVPVFYNFAKNSLKTSQLYYTIAKNTNLEISTSLEKDQVLKISAKNIEFIPLQTSSQNNVLLNIQNQLLESGFYTILNGNTKIKTVAFNYNREESKQQIIDLKSLFETKNNISISTSIAESLGKINNQQKINWLFKWFLAFSVLFLLIEMLILKYFNK